MWLRRAFFWWLIPAAFLLPLWLFVGWIVTGAGGWALLWVFLAVPGVFIWQLVLSLLVRARGSVRADRAVSWWDVAAFAVWHVLVIALGLFDPAWWGAVLVAALAVGIGTFWLELWQLWQEAKPGRLVLRTSEGVAYVPPAESTPRSEPREHEVIVITENRTPPSA